MLGIAALAVVGLGIYLVSSDDDDDDGTTTSDDNIAAESDDDTQTESGDPTEPAYAYVEAWADKDCPALRSVVAEESQDSIDGYCDEPPGGDSRDGSVDSVDILSEGEDQAVLAVIGEVEYCFESEPCETTELDEEVTVVDEDGSWKISTWETADGNEIVYEGDPPGPGDDLDDEFLDDPTYDDDYPGYES